MIDFMKETVYFGNTIAQYTLAAFTFISIIILVYIIRRIVITKVITAIRQPKDERVVNVIESFRKRLLPISYILAVYGALPIIKIPATIDKIVDKGAIVFISVFVILFITDCVDTFAKGHKSQGRLGLQQGMISIFKFLIWIFGILFIFANLGYNVNTFITGLGIGGVAIALASQAILGDLFNYFVILFDKPFKVGDPIQIDTMQGHVEYIGIKSTRIRSYSGEQTLISNTDLTKSRLRNYKNMERRRNLMILGVEYGTPADKLKMIPDTIKKVVTSVENVELARVHFSEIGAYSLNFELAYYVLSDDYAVYIAAVDKINYGLIDAFSQLGVSFAFPSQTIYTQQQ